LKERKNSQVGVIKMLTLRCVEHKNGADWFKKAIESGEDLL